MPPSLLSTLKSLITIQLPGKVELSIALLLPAAMFPLPKPSRTILATTMSQTATLFAPAFSKGLRIRSSKLTSLKSSSDSISRSSEGNGHVAAEKDTNGMAGASGGDHEIAKNGSASANDDGSPTGNAAASLVVSGVVSLVAALLLLRRSLAAGAA